MSIKLGNTSIGSLYLGSTKISEAYLGSTKVFGSSTPTLPPYTIRLKFTDGITPTFYVGTAVQVSASPNIWDLTYENTNWNSACNFQPELIEVLGANTSGVTNMGAMFDGCTSLTSVPLFDTSSCTTMFSMFLDCTSLTSVPLFDTSSCTAMDDMFEGCTSLTSIPLFDTSICYTMNFMFNGCTNVGSGALALYQQASTQATPPRYHSYTFTNCGRDTVTGAAELAQIPTSWGGTMA